MARPNNRVTTFVAAAVVLVGSAWWTLGFQTSFAQDAAVDKENTANAADSPAAEAPATTPAPVATGVTPKNPGDPSAKLKRLSPDSDVWIDTKNKQVVMPGKVCLRSGLLELFACLEGTKEHESIVSVKTKAYVAHAALLALGAKSGTPARWDPKYAPATGTTVDIDVYWTDAEGKLQKARAQDWIRDLQTKEAMKPTWVFAGSGFHKDPETGHQYYLAESGDFICVSNFPTAMLDLPIESSQANAELAFEAFAEKIPPRGTEVILVLKPQLDDKPAEKKPDETKPAESPKVPAGEDEDAKPVETAPQ